jgi:phage tail-like protein
VIQNPLKGFRFLVEISGIQQAGFSECSSVGSHLEVVEYRDGGDVINVQKFPGKVSYPDITLKWGMTDNHDLYDLHLKAVQGSPTKVSGSVIQLDDTGSETVRWNFFNAWPSKWDGPTYNAKGNELSINTLTLTCERIELAS